MRTIVIQRFASTVRTPFSKQVLAMSIRIPLAKKPVPNRLWAGLVGWGAALALGLTVAGCGGGGGGSSTASGVQPTSTASAAPTLSALAQLGEQVFKDPSLSASGSQSCASCHDAAHGHAPANNLSAQLGGTTGSDQQGLRAAPAIRYLVYNTGFAFAADGTPTGGFFWDGRAATLAEQAAQPFLNEREMANGSKAEVMAKLAQASYAPAFKALFGAGFFDDVDSAFQRVTLALQAYQKEDTDFAPFSSKYDAFLRGGTSLSPQELRGLAWFNSPAKGNCAACHPSAKSADGRHPLFTDFSYDALGVPRNWALAANSDAAYQDRGLCDSAALTGLALSEFSRQALCGAFKVPSLRNVALRQSYFHNGAFHDLKTVVTFYVQRDTNPEKWYLRADGSVDLATDGSVNKFNDLSAAHKANVNVSEAPYNRPLGGTPALSEAEIDDVVAFLQTLSDGWSP
jgi:cytochrome c peroxidase